MEQVYFTFDPQCEALAKNYIRQFGWRTQPSPQDLFELNLNQQGLSLQRHGEKSNPLLVDWSQGQSPQQIRKRFTQRDPWVKALGSSKEFTRVIDATLGFGEDTFIMALLGFHVTAYERSSVIYALAENALSRLPEEFAMVRERIHLIHGDFTYSSNSFPFDLIYLDPMYPEKTKTALPKKQMRWLRELLAFEVTSTNNDSALFEKAVSLRPRKIVVKRPKGAPPLAPTPQFQSIGQSTRYDVYFGDRIKWDDSLR